MLCISYSDSITKIAFTDESALLHVMNESKDSLYVYSRNSNDNSTYEYTSSYKTQLQERQVIYFHNVPEHDNSLMIVTTKRALYIKWARVMNGNGYSVCNFKKQERAYVENDSITYVCAAITYDGDYLVVADSGGFVNVWHTDVGYQPIATYKNRVTSLDTYWFNQCYHLVCIAIKLIKWICGYARDLTKFSLFSQICGTEDSLLHKWKLPVQASSTTLVR